MKKTSWDLPGQRPYLTECYAYNIPLGGVLVLGIGHVQAVSPVGQAPGGADDTWG